MICKELKNISGNIFGFKKRLSIGKIDNDDRIPLTDQMHSSIYCHDYTKDEFVEKSKHFTDDKILSEEGTKFHNNSSIIIDEEKQSEKKTTKNISPEKQYVHSTDGQEFQEDWSFTWYDFDGRGKITRKDMSTMMKSLYDIIKHNTKNRNSRFINHYKLHLVLMTKDISNVQGLDLATSYEQIYQMDSVMTSLTNLTLASSEEDDQDSDNTIGGNNTNTNRLKHSNRKSFSGRCFEELNEMRARKIEKRSKSTPTDHQLRHKRKENYCENVFKRDLLSISTSLMSLAGSSLDIHCNRSKLRRERTKSGKNKINKRSSKTVNEILGNKSLSTSCRNIANSFDCLDQNVTIRQKHVKSRNKQQRKKDLGRKQVEDWLQIDGQKENSENLASDLQLIHHHYHHYHQSSNNKMVTDGIDPIRLRDCDLDNCLNNERSHSRLQEIHHHVHLHHHHHHYFY